MVNSRVTEEQRVATLAEYRVVGSVPDPRLDAIMAALVATSGAALAKLAFVDSHISWVKATNTTNFVQVPRSASFCSKYVVDPVRTVIVPDLSQATPDMQDRLARYSDHPVEAVAGVPLTAPNGAAIGALLVLDTKPRDFTMTQVEALTRAARKVMELLESTRAAYELAGGAAIQGTDDDPGLALTSAGNLATANLPLDSAEATPLADNSRSIVEEFVSDNLARSGWWAAQVWWAEDDQLYPEPWVIEASAPEVVSKLRSRSGAVPIPFSGVEFGHPTLVDLESAPWMGNLANIAQAGVRHLMVLDVASALTSSLRIVFVVPEGVRVQPETISALETGALLLPRVLRQEQARGELLYRSTHDALTGLLNRRGLDQVVGPIEGSRTEQVHAVIYLDLDRFKQVNDTHGHAVGDQLLKYVSAQILRQMRPTDSVVRLGGDEFVVLAKNIGSIAAAYNLGRRLLHELNGSFVAETGVQLKVAASIGVAIWRTGALFDEALKVADALMYQAKQAGGSLAVEELAGTNSVGANTLFAVSRDDLRLLTVTATPILATATGLEAGLLIDIASPLRAISASQVKSAVAEEIASLGGQIPARILLRFSNHFWNHGRMIPQLLSQLSTDYPATIFQAVIDAALIGANLSEALQVVVDEKRNGIVLSGVGVALARFDLLDRLSPTGISTSQDIGAVQSGLSASRAVTAIASVATGLGIDLFALDQSTDANPAHLAKLGFDFLCCSKPIQSTTNQGE